MRRVACWVALCWLLLCPELALGQAAEVTGGALTFAPPEAWAAATRELPEGLLYAARSADGRWALAVTREALRRGEAGLDALAARYRGVPGVTVGEPLLRQGVELLPLWEHRSQGEEPFTLHMLACALDGTLYRFILIDQAAAGPEDALAARTLAALNIRLTEEATP